MSDIDRYQPLANFVLIERIDQAKERDEKSGMFIPEIAQVRSNKGRVVAVGDGRFVGDTLIPIPLERGDIVLFSKYGAEDITLDGKEFLLLRYDEIKLKERLVALVS